MAPRADVEFLILSLSKDAARSSNLMVRQAHDEGPESRNRGRNVLSCLRRLAGTVVGQNLGHHGGDAFGRRDMQEFVRPMGV